MKKKFLICFLSLIICFNSFNFSYAYGKSSRLVSVAIAPEIIGTIATVAVASGIIISSSDDIYDISRVFYEKYSDNWEMVETLFKATVTVSANKVVSIGSDFLNLCKDAFDTFINFSTPGSSTVPFVGKYGAYDVTKLVGYVPFTILGGKSLMGYKMDLNKMVIYGPDGSVASTLRSTINPKNCGLFLGYYYGSYELGAYSQIDIPGSSFDKYYQTDVKNSYIPLSLKTEYELPNSYESYNWDNNISANLKNDKVEVNLPGNVGDLVGVRPNDVVYNPSLNPPYDLPIGGTVTLPNVNNPSLEVGDSISIPNEGVVNPPLDPPLDPPIDGVFPTFPSFGDSLDFSPLYLTGVTEKFPFSLPWDIGRILDRFDVSPKAPVFKVPIVSETIEIDFTVFEEWVFIFRFFILMAFVIGLIYISTRLKG